MNYIQAIWHRIFYGVIAIYFFLNFSIFLLIFLFSRFFCFLKKKNFFALLSILKKHRKKVCISKNKKTNFISSTNINFFFKNKYYLLTSFKIYFFHKNCMYYLAFIFKSAEAMISNFFSQYGYHRFKAQPYTFLFLLVNKCYKWTKLSCFLFIQTIKLCTVFEEI